MKKFLIALEVLVCQLFYPLTTADQALLRIGNLRTLTHRYVLEILLVDAVWFQDGQLSQEVKCKNSEVVIQLKLLVKANLEHLKPHNLCLLA